MILESDYIKVITSIDDYHDVEKILEEKGIDIIESKLDFVPENDITIDDFDKALKFKKMLEAFNEDEDVSLVSSNEVISEDLEKQVDEFIEKNTFKS
jgi:transcriptional/translational regulatory protein YebC/TACO1